MKTRLAFLMLSSFSLATPQLLADLTEPQLLAATPGPSTPPDKTTSAPTPTDIGLIKYIDRSKCVVSLTSIPDTLKIGSRLTLINDDDQSSSPPITMTVIVLKAEKKLLAAKFDTPPPKQAPWLGRRVALIDAPATTTIPASTATAAVAATAATKSSSSDTTMAAQDEAIASNTKTKANTKTNTSTRTDTNTETTSASPPDDNKPPQREPASSRHSPFALRLAYGQAQSNVVPIVTGINVTTANPLAQAELTSFIPASSWLNNIGLRIAYEQAFSAKVALDDKDTGTSSQIHYEHARLRAGLCAQALWRPWLTTGLCLFPWDQQQDDIKVGSLRDTPPYTMKVSTQGLSADVYGQVLWPKVIAIGLRYQPGLKQSLKAKESDSDDGSHESRGDWSSSRLQAELAYPFTHASWRGEIGISAAQRQDQGHIKGEGAYTKSKSGQEAALYTSACFL